MKKFSSKEVLEIVGAAVADTLPEDSEGTLNLSYNDDGDIEVYFTSEEAPKVDKIPN